MKNKNGYTLIELVAGMVVMAIITASLASAYGQITKAFVYNVDQAKAVELSNLEFSIINGLGYNLLTLGTTNNYDNPGYDIQRHVTLVPGTITNNNRLKQITVTIYKKGGTIPILTTITYRAYNVSYKLY